MKSVKKIVAVVFLAACICLSVGMIGCYWEHEPYDYYIGEEYAFGEVKIKVDVDKQNEMFIYSCKAEPNYKYVHLFYFTFTIAGYLEIYRNDEEFEFTDSTGAEVTFDELGYYRYYGDREIYISYANSNGRIKESIANDEYDLEVDGGTFIPNPFN